MSVPIVGWPGDGPATHTVRFIRADSIHLRRHNDGTRRTDVMGGHYAPHGGNLWASARIRNNQYLRSKPSTSVNAPPGSPALGARANSLTNEPLRAAAALQRWLRTRGAPEALRLLRAIGSSARHALDDVELAAQRLAAEVPVQNEDDQGTGSQHWSLWQLLLRIAFWAVFALLAALRWLGRVRVRAVRKWKLARKRAVALEKLDKAKNYEEWTALAEELDAIEGRAKWKDDPPVADTSSTRWRTTKHKKSSVSTAVHAVCDLDMLAAKLADLARLYECGDVRGLAFALRASMQRNYAGMCHPELSNHSRIGTSRVVEDYVHVVSYLLAYIAQSDNAPSPSKHSRNIDSTSSRSGGPPHLSDDHNESNRLLSVGNKLLMFNEARIAYGRTALMLSGGASMGINHLGVVKALLDQNLMPKVVCGTSAGALVGSIVGIFDDHDLLSILNSEELINPLSKQPFSFKYFDEHTNFARRMRRFIRYGAIQDVRMLQDCLRRNFGDITFQEAYMRTRRILNITVCAKRAPSDPPMLLNYLTAPHVLVWSAAAASCALPFVFAPVELVAKGYDGRIVPYHPHGVRWIDGSITSDIPLARIGELFNVNHFIVSQTNPHIIPRGAPFLKTRLAMLIKSELQFRYWQATQLNLVPRFLSAVFPHFMQPYEGDVTIFPEVNLTDIKRLLRNPTAPVVRECIRRGELTTFPFLDRIRRQCIIERALDASVEHVARMQRPSNESFATPVSPGSPELRSSNLPVQASKGGYKRGNSFFGRVPSWLWLDPSSLLSATPLAVANRISAATETAPSTPDGIRTPDIEPQIPVMKLTSPSASGSPSLLKHSNVPQRTELEKLWVEFGVNQAAERVALAGRPRNEDSETPKSTEPSSSDASEEDERVLC